METMTVFGLTLDPFGSVCSDKNRASSAVQSTAKLGKMLTTTYKLAQVYLDTLII